MMKYLVHYDSDKSEMQLRRQHNVALGFYDIKQSIPIDKESVPKSKDKWLDWHDKWKWFFIKTHQLNPNDVQ